MTARRVLRLTAVVRGLDIGEIELAASAVGLAQQVDSVLPRVGANADPFLRSAAPRPDDRLVILGSLTHVAIIRRHRVSGMTVRLGSVLGAEDDHLEYPLCSGFCRGKLRRAERRNPERLSVWVNLADQDSAMCVE